jgi:hypothetical protein
MVYTTINLWMFKIISMMYKLRIILQIFNSLFIHKFEILEKLVIKYIINKKKVDF